MGSGEKGVGKGLVVRMMGGDRGDRGGEGGEEEDGVENGVKKREGDV